MDETSSKHNDDAPLFSAGDRVRILKGPFTGFTATIETVDGVNQRARLLIHAFAIVRDPVFNLQDLARDPENDVE